MQYCKKDSQNGIKVKRKYKETPCFMYNIDEMCLSADVNPT